MGAPISRPRVIDWIKNKSLQYAAYKELTLGQRSNIYCKLGDGKKKTISCEWEIQERLSLNPYIRQNRF